MSPQVDTKDIMAVQRHVESAYRSLFPDAGAQFVPKVFGWTRDCFEGRHEGYQPIDACYHDLEHTLQGTLCMTRILQGRHHAQAEPACSRHLFELGLLAILLHDTGYLKSKGDREGTGAKYTLIHVHRSMDFAAALLEKHGFSAADIRAVQSMIRCTGVNVDLTGIPFDGEMERITGYALGTGDLLGQMAADDYVEKLPILFQEFAEAQGFSGQPQTRIAFSSAADLIRQTPAFWRNYVKPKIDVSFLGLYRFLSDPYPDGANPYILRIEANLRKIEQKPAGAV